MARRRRAPVILTGLGEPELPADAVTVAPIDVQLDQVASRAGKEREILGGPTDCVTSGVPLDARQSLARIREITQANGIKAVERMREMLEDEEWNKLGGGGKIKLLGLVSDRAFGRPTATLVRTPFRQAHLSVEEQLGMVPPVEETVTVDESMAMVRRTYERKRKGLPELTNAKPATEVGEDDVEDAETVG